MEKPKFKKKIDEIKHTKIDYPNKAGQPPDYWYCCGGVRIEISNKCPFCGDEY